MASMNISCSNLGFTLSQDQKYVNGFDGVRSSFAVRTGNPLGMSIISLTKRSSFSQKDDVSARAAVISGEILQPGAIAFEELSAEVVPTNGFSPDNDEFNEESRPEGFATIQEAIKDIQDGKMVIVVDDEDGESGGDLIMPASLVKPEDTAFMVKHGTGIICVSMKEEDLRRLQIPQMVTLQNEDETRAAFTVSVDAKHGTNTGVSADDRATTIQALASKESNPEDFNRPGHIFPLKYREGGVLKRAGHTEASVDLAVLAGFGPVAVLCQIVDDDGSMAKLPKLRLLAERENLKIVSIADLISYRSRKDKLIEPAFPARMPTMWGPFSAYCFKSVVDGIEHVAMVKGDIGDGHDVLVRVHSECLTGDIFGSARCDCGPQLALAMQKIEAAGRGVLVYLRGHEGRGIGLAHKLRAYNLQDAGRDTVEANEDLGLPADARDYGVGAQILVELGVKSLKLMTNNPTKFVGLKGYGLAMAGRVPLVTPVTNENRRYLETKRSRMGHIYGTEFNGLLADLVNNNDTL
ncbi:hypothetical protein MKX03_018932 [Papaver bracteatum]|nr:hypothetical protein MKX03_018932 [Papaver bracteatum]